MPAAIKGVVLQYVMEPLQRFLEQGRVSRQDLEARLEKADLELFEDKVIAGLWYPIDSFGRLIDLSCELSGVREPRQFVDVGYAVSEQFLHNQVFGDMVRTASGRGSRAGHALVRLFHLLLNFSEWTFHNESDDGRHFRIEVTDAGEIPDGLMRVVQGVIEYLSTRVFAIRLQVTCTRPTTDTIVYRAVPPRD